MSWELISFAILGAGLVAGFAWYERSQPGSRMLALVATLAALAAIGRIAFAPIPNVKPTTDIVLIAGLVLGGAPGFVVGSVAALASNLLFGQGPWTPWQMAAWGLCGILGALIGRMTSRQVGRLPLALACAGAGLMFGAIMDASIWVTYGGGQGVSQYLAIAATSLPFNFAHAAGNFVFALAFGPALVRALARFRDRMEVSWGEPAPAARVGRGVAGPAVLLLAATLCAGMLAAPFEAAAASVKLKAARYLVSAQNRDGGWGPAPGARSNAVQTSWAVVGLAAAGYDPLRVKMRGRTPTALLRRYAERSRSTADIERTAIALAAAGLPASTGGLSARLRRSQRADGSFAGLINLTSYGLIALRASGLPAGSSRVQRAARWIEARQNSDGSFNYARRGAPGTIDDTAGALQALAAAGRRGSASQEALAYLLSRQNGDGGFAFQPPGRSNSQSTALTVQAMVSMGSNPALKRRASRSPLGFLGARQMSNGLIRYSSTSAATPVWVTSQSLAALGRRALPVRIRR